MQLKDIMLAIYSIASISYLFIIITLVFIYDPMKIIKFPCYIVDILKDTFANPPNFSFNNLKELFIPLVFYILLFKLITKPLKRTCRFIRQKKS